ncbi:hypothetical protein EVAR_28246_1 [Eumeta japonica]|uniref:Reverse transcriptase domain-containing protein n=1 Tax=Eumeta variegata TaxID=151549 RepID=A0A4C1V727_EUMVA|nr:hypothetical protein EVAR_28246_1 [Eumeta japonica]
MPRVGFILSERLSEYVNGYECENIVKERWNNYFESIFPCKDTVADDYVTATENMIDDGKDSKITMDEIMRALKCMKFGRAARYDRVSLEMLRGGGGIVARQLHQLFSNGKKSHRHGVSSGLIRALQFLPRVSSACFRINGAYTDWFDIRRGFRQGYIDSPWLFILFMNSCLYDLKEYESELRLDELSVKCFLCADDQVIFAPSTCGLHNMVNKMNDSVKRRDMKVKVGKTKVMVFERGESTAECYILIEAKLRSKRAGVPSSPPMDTRNPRGITSVFSASWEEIEYVTEGDPVDVRGRRGMGYWNSHSLDERQQRMLLPRVRIL